jgi:hypothetical protein
VIFLCLIEQELNQFYRANLRAAPIQNSVKSAACGGSFWCAMAKMVRFFGVCLLYDHFGAFI